jgi:RNA polymerase sigma factor (sigma-70 family)
MGSDDTLTLLPSLAATPAATDGSWDAFVTAWWPLQDRLFRIALLIARDRSDAEDAVSDAMAATYAPWKAGRVRALDAYARRAVVNCLTSKGRRRVTADRHRQRRTGDERGFREVADHVVDRDLVREALLELPAKQRAIVVLRYYAQLSVGETASTLGIAEGTVKSQTHDALRALRVRLGPTREGDA